MGLEARGVAWGSASQSRAGGEGARESCTKSAVRAEPRSCKTPEEQANPGMWTEPVEWTETTRWEE